MVVLCMCQTGEFLCSGSPDKSISILKRGACSKLSQVGVISGHEGPVKCLQASLNNIGNILICYQSYFFAFVFILIEIYSVMHKFGRLFKV